MIHTLLNSLEEKIKSNFAIVKEVRYYKGEFEEGSQWNPFFPAVFVNAPLINPGQEGSEKWLKAAMTVNIYTAIKMENAEQTEFFENLILYINNLNSDTDLKTQYTFEMKPAVLVAYVAGVEAYRIELTARKVIV